MSYRLEKSDIVISGFEKGIADSPYNGLSDMRNVNNIGVPNEAFCEFSPTPITAPPILNAVSVTVNGSTNEATWAGSATLYNGCAISFNSITGGIGLSTGVVYYVKVLTTTTFTLHRTPSVADTVVDITGNGSGTFTTYQYGNQRGLSGGGSPNSYYVDRTGAANTANAVYITDKSNYAWYVLASTSVNTPANSLIFLGNIGGVGADSNSATGVAVWNGYLMLFGLSGVDVANVQNLIRTTGPISSWTYNWWSANNSVDVDGRINVIVSEEDGNLYYISTAGLGSIIETPNDTFDPSDPTSYTRANNAVLLPSTDSSTCLAELGSYIYIGGVGSSIYMWDKISLGFEANILKIADNFTTQLVATDQNVFAFTGNRGRIYITNAASIQEFMKVPDYITGAIIPSIRFRDASYSRGQLTFSFTASTNAGVTLDTVSGVWGIYISTNSLRLITKTSNSGYSASVRMGIEQPQTSRTFPSADIRGNGLLIGWDNGSTVGIDVSSNNPFSNYESYIEMDLIPIGTYLNPFTGSQVEWKTSAPLVNGESIRISYRTNLSDAFVEIGTSTVSSVNMVGSTTGITLLTNQSGISDYYNVNFQKSQWIQLKVELKSTNTSPSYARLTEVRIRDYNN